MQAAAALGIIGPSLSATYPPGYSALLAPLALVSGTAYAAFRGLSLGLLVVVVDSVRKSRVIGAQA